MPSLSTRLSAWRRPLLADTKGNVGNGAQACKRCDVDVEADGMLQHQALRTAFFRHEGHPGFDRLGFVGDVEARSSKLEMTRVGPLYAGCQMRQLGAAGADQSAERQTPRRGKTSKLTPFTAPRQATSRTEKTGLLRSVRGKACTVFGATGYRGRRWRG